MKSLLIIAHGSRREASNDEVRTLTCEIARQSSQDFALVDCAFLELATPSIPDGISACIAQGATDILILPYFLSAGRHVTEDIPSEVLQSRALYPDIRIEIAPYLGAHAAVAEIMATQARAFHC